jgi:hypothetical protein
MLRRDRAFLPSVSRLSALAAIAFVAACSSAASDEVEPGSAEGSFDRSSEGLHAEGKPLPITPPVTPPLGPPVPILVPPSAPPGTMSLGCIQRTNCALTTSLGPSYTVPSFPFKGVCASDTSFTDQLTEMGCSTEVGYTSLSGEFTDPIAFCPHAPVDTNIPWEVMPCDSCTGEAPPGWVIIAWTYWPCRNTTPGGSCDLGGCLPAITE